MSRIAPVSVPDPNQPQHGSLPARDTAIRTGVGLGLELRLGLDKEDKLEPFKDYFTSEAFTRLALLYHTHVLLFTYKPYFFILGVETLHWELIFWELTLRKLTFWYHVVSLIPRPHPSFGTASGGGAWERGYHTVEPLLKGDPRVSYTLDT